LANPTLAEHADKNSHAPALVYEAPEQQQRVSETAQICVAIERQPSQRAARQQQQQPQPDDDKDE
jgi:hypothetical protein